MFWPDRFASEIIKSGKYRPYHVDDMKTPSGRIHVGALRGVIVHDLIFKALKEKGKKVDYTWVFNDMDPMDAFPHYLPEKFKKYLGWPLFKIPSPEPGHQSFSRLYAKEFIDVFKKLGCRPKIIWSSEYYQQGKFNQAITEALTKVKKVRKLYQEISGYDKPKDWYPFQVICPQCGKVGTTMVYDWDGKKVSFACKKDLVAWAEGCGYKGKISPFNGTGKLMWKVDWAAHWKVIGVTVEGAGKDHMSKGGSHDLSSAICEQVFNYPPPFAFLYEWFLARGGTKMSSSKGVGVSAREVSGALPPQILRFLISKPNYRKAIIFDPNNNESILDLFDEYDHFGVEYFQEGTKSDFARIWQMSQVGPIPKSKPFYPRFRDVANYLQQPGINLERKFTEIKGIKLSQLEKKILKERIYYARIWLKKYAPKELVYAVVKKVSKEAKNLVLEQKQYLAKVADLLNVKAWQPEELQVELYNLAKKLKIPPKKAFQAIYLALTGKSYGPKAAWFLLDKDKKFVIKRFKEVQKTKEKKKEYLYEIIDRPDLFSIDQQFKQKYPSVTVGLAIIKGVKIKKEDKKLEQEISNFIHSQQGLTTQDIGQYPEIKSYRRIYKETGVDWHSKRPSPEALLRRIAQAKPLPNVNTCVDAYNLVVMKKRVSAGAFNLDQIKFPTVLRFAKKGEKIHLLGDKEITDYNLGEVAYFDKIEGYNIHFNYKDAQRTRVTEKTKNLLINAEGVYEISRNQVEKSLKEVIEMILKYCGGKLELAGIVQ